jgi:AraC-like DNA-binding protein
LSMRSKSLLTKMILFGCVLSILPVVFVGAFSYVQSSKQVQKQIDNGEVQYVKQVNSNIEQILITVNHTLNNLVDSTVMNDVLRTPLRAGDFKVYSNLVKEITHLQGFDTMVEDVVIVNNKQQWLVNNSGLDRLSENEDMDTYLSYFDLNTNSAWVLLKNDDFNHPIISTKCDYTISLVKKLPVRKSSKYGLVFANIPACSLSEVISVEQESEEFIVIDRNNQIMMHQDPSMIGKSLMETPYFETIEDKFSASSGQFQTTHENHPYTITYYRSGFNDWTYLSVVSIDELTKESKQIGWFTLYISLAIILLSVVFVWLISKRMYSPVNKLLQYLEESGLYNKKEPKTEVQIIEEHIKNLFSSNTKLELEINNHKQQTISIFLNRLFSGNLRKSEINEKMKYFGLDQLSAKWENMTVLTLQVDTLDETRYEVQDLELLLFAVSNIIEEKISLENRLPTVWFDQTLVVLVGSTKTDFQAIHDYTYELTESIQLLIKMYLDLSVSIGISLPFQEIKKASTAYNEGLRALKHRIKLGKGVIIPYSTINSHKQTIVYEYPGGTELELMDAIKLSDREESLRLLQCWMDKAFYKSQSPGEYQISMMRLLNNLLVVKQEAGISFEQIGAHEHSLYESLLKLNMRVDIEEWFKEQLIIPLIQVFSDRRDSQYRNLSEEIVHMIQKYYDTDITLEDCASKLHYNANYLSSVFRKETGFTFSEYLSNYRFQMAKKWLIETDLTIKEIADKLKYNNSQNFIRSFRKLEGTTPGQYRSKYVDL